MTSLTVLLWHVAICLVDIVIVAISDLLFTPITTGGLVQTAGNLILVQNWLLFPFIMAFAAIITVFFYLAVPFVAGAIMKGMSGTTAALQAGIQGTLQAAGLAVGAGLTAATLGGSTAVQGAAAGAQAMNGASTAAGRLANDVSGSGAGGDVPLPPPVPSEPAESSGNDTVSNPANPAMVAHQTAPNTFAVVDHDKGTVSHHPGSIATPHAAQAAFNAHTAKAQPLPQDSPLATRNI